MTLRDVIVAVRQTELHALCASQVERRLQQPLIGAVLLSITSTSCYGAIMVSGVVVILACLVQFIAVRCQNMETCFISAGNILVAQHPSSNVHIIKGLSCGLRGPVWRYIAAEVC